MLLRYKKSLSNQELELGKQALFYTTIASARTYFYNIATDGEAAAAAMRKDKCRITVIRKVNEACKRMLNFQAAIVLIYNRRKA
jgi:hypothetical protein